jgi:hypothetical protein
MGKGRCFIMTGKLQSLPVAVLLWAGAMICCSEVAPGASLPPIKSRQVALPIYAEGESNAVAVLRAERVVRDQRRLGFFRVTLLPVLVVERARLDLEAAGLRENALARVQAGLEPLAGKLPVEFRGFQVFLPGEKTARLSARLVRPAAGSGSPAWTLEQVTLQSDQGPVVLPQARLLLDGEPGRLVWPAPGGNAEWHLFRGTFATNQLASSKRSQ